MHLILSSLKESFALIWKNKWLFALLFFLQIIFSFIFFYINSTYQIKILESTKAITDYLSQQNLDDTSIASSILQQKSILGDDPLMISRNFKEIVKNFRLYLIYSFISIVIFMSVAWTITHKIIHRNNFRQLIRSFFRIFIISLFYLGLIFSFFFTLLNISLTDIAVESSKLLTKYVPFLILSIALIYFMFISLALINNTEFKNIVQKTLSVGIKKAHYILAIYFINLFLFGISIFLLYYFIERNLFVLLLSLILMIFSFVFGRIFMVNVVEKLE